MGAWEVYWSSTELLVVFVVCVEGEVQDGRERRDNGLEIEFRRC